MRNTSYNEIMQAESQNNPSPVKGKLIYQQKSSVARDNSGIKTSMIKLNSSLFHKQSKYDSENLRKKIDDESDFKSLPKQNVILMAQEKQNQQSKRQSKIRDSNNLSITAPNININQNGNNISNSDSKTQLVKLITRYRSLTQEDERRKGSCSPNRRDSYGTPLKKQIQFSEAASQAQINRSSSITFITSSQADQEEFQKRHQQIQNNTKRQLKRSQTMIHISETNKSQNSKLTSTILKEQKEKQCVLIKSAFTLLPNNRYLPLDDEKVLTIKTPVSSSDSSSSETDFPAQRKQAAAPLNESSKQFLKKFLKKRRIEEKMLNCRQKSNEVRQIQQTILNKVLNEMNKEKERQLIIKNMEQVKFSQKNNKKSSGEDFNPLVHYRPKDNFCKNKNVIVKMNQGFHPPKDTAAIARDQQEEYKNFIIPCQKSNFFGSEARRMLNRGVPQIIQSLNNIKY